MIVIPKVVKTVISLSFKPFTNRRHHNVVTVYKE